MSEMDRDSSQPPLQPPPDEPDYSKAGAILTSQIHQLKNSLSNLVSPNRLSINTHTHETTDSGSVTSSLASSPVNSTYPSSNTLSNRQIKLLHTITKHTVLGGVMIFSIVLFAVTALVSIRAG